MKQIPLLISKERKACLWFATLVFLVAASVRVVFMLGTQFQVEVAGDINAWLAYAWNLDATGIYSSQWAQPPHVPVPDAFRPPGYPWLLWGCLELSGSEGWLALARWVQIFLGSLTAALTVVLGWRFLPSWLALLSGLILAIWPHHVVLSVTLLSETLLGVCLVAGFTLIAGIPSARRPWVRAALGGLILGYAAMVNSLMLLLPLFVVPLLWWHRLRQAALVFAFAFCLLPGTWRLASPGLPPDAATSMDRAAMNFIQGSWPQYHSAWRTRERSQLSLAIMRALDDEVALARAKPLEAMHRIRARWAEDPVRYLKWYLLEKPFELWAWNIQLGWQGFHFLPVKGTTPFERYPVLKAVTVVLKSMNPFIFILALTGLASVVAQAARRGRPPFAALLVAAFVLYVTALHAIFQAEPRYSTPYRAFELLLACYAIGPLAGGLRHLKSKLPPLGSVPVVRSGRD